MGKFWGWFFGKPVTTLVKMKEERQEKVDALMEEIKAIDEEIARRNKEDNKSN